MEVSGNINEIHKSAKTTINGVRDCSESSGELSELSGTLQDLVAQFKLREDIPSES